jgi:hypothetical protein
VYVEVPRCTARSLKLSILVALFSFVLLPPLVWVVLTADQLISLASVTAERNNYGETLIFQEKSTYFACIIRPTASGRISSKLSSPKNVL